MKILTIIFSAILITGVTSIVIGRLISKNIMNKQITDHLVTVALSRTNYIITVLEEYKKATEILAVGNPAKDILNSDKKDSIRKKQVQRRIANTIETIGNISRIRVLDRNGIVVASSHSDEGIDESANILFKKGKEKTYIGDLHISDYTGNLVISVASPIIIKGKSSGVLVMNFDTEDELFKITTNKIGLGQTGEIYLVNKECMMITPSGIIDDAVLKQKIEMKHLKSSIFQELLYLPEYKPEIVLTENYLDVEVLRIYTHIPEVEWCLVTEINKEEAFAPIFWLTYQLLLILAILLAFGIIVSIFLSKAFTAPIIKLYTGTREIIKGNLDYRVGTKASDEIGQLSRAFDEMTENLKVYRKELDSYSKDLEQKVEDRTAEVKKQFLISEKQRIATLNIAQDFEDTNIKLIKEIDKRRIAKESLLKSEKKFRDLFKNANDVIWTSDIKGKYLTVNRLFEELLGYSQKELINKQSIYLITPEDRKASIEYYKKVISGKSIEYEAKILTKKGEQKIFWLKLRPIKENRKVVGIHGIGRDITERKRAEEKYINQLKNMIELGISMRMELKLENLLYNIGSMIVNSLGWEQVIISLRDYKSGTSRPVAMVGFDEKVKKDILSKPPVPIKGTSKFQREEFKISHSYYIDHRNWEKLKKYPAHLVVTHQKSQKQEGWDERDVLLIPIRGKNNILGFISPDNPLSGKRPTVEIIQALEIFADQSAVAIENATLYKDLKSSESRFHDIVNNSGDWIWETDEKGCYIYSSSMVKDVLGYSSEGIIGKYFYDFFAENQKDELKKIINDYYKKKKPFKNFINKKIHKNDSEVILETSGVPIIGNNGELVGYRGADHNITLRQKAAEKIKASLREKEVMLMEIHHRVKNNLQIISSMLKLQAGYVEHKPSLGLFKDSQNRVKSMSLVHEKLYQSKDLSSINFSNYVESLISFLLSSYGSDPDKIKLKINIQEDLINISTAIPIGLIINELVSNSLKYAFPNGKKGTIEVILISQKDKKKCLIICDDGIGFQGKIDFNNTDTMGLFLVNTLVDQIHGTIKLEKKKGTSFKIVFSGVK